MFDEPPVQSGGFLHFRRLFLLENKDFFGYPN